MVDRPSERWTHVRLFGQEFNDALQRSLVSFLEDQGFLAVAPEQDETLFKFFQDPPVGRASTWSQRHIAYAAGLGTFGLSDAIITPAGKAHNLGSVVVNFPLESPTRSPDIHQHCLFYQGFGCMACARRCPVGVITEAGHDKSRCADFVFSNTKYIRATYAIDIYACGLCLTGVPCERGIPDNLVE